MNCLILSVPVAQQLQQPSNSIQSFQAVKLRSPFLCDVGLHHYMISAQVLGQGLIFRGQEV